MSGHSATADLQVARILAHKLFVHCRESPSSYKLLAGSVKELRNVLEDVEEFLDDHNAAGDNANLPERIARSRTLLEQLDVSLQSYRSSSHRDVQQSTVADFKTALDLVRQQLQLDHDSVAAGEITLHFNHNHARSASQSTGLALTSTSAIESSHGHRTSSQTSSAMSSVTRDPDGAGLRPESGLERRPSEEKEVFHTSAQAMPNVDWNSPFYDPMSISIEEASSMILQDDVPPTIPIRRSQSIAGPVMSTRVPQPKRTEETSPDVLHGLGISASDPAIVNTIPSRDSVRERIESPRASSESPRPLQSSSHLVPPQSKVPANITVATNDARDSQSIPHGSPTFARGNSRLSPRSASREFGHRIRTGSGSSITFSTRHVENGETATSSKSRRSAEDLRKELSAVLENAFGDAEILAPADVSSQPGVIMPRDSRTALAVPLPPPVRRAPLPPKKRRTPKIPQRFSTYRIVNSSMTDDDSSSSEEEDLYSSSLPTTPIIPTPVTTPRPIADQTDGSEIDRICFDRASDMRSEPQGGPDGANAVVPAQISMASSAHKDPPDQSSVQASSEDRPALPPKAISHDSGLRDHGAETSSPPDRRSISSTQRDYRPIAEEHIAKMKFTRAIPERVLVSVQHSRSKSSSGAGGGTSLARIDPATEPKEQAAVPASGITAQRKPVPPIPRSASLDDALEAQALPIPRENEQPKMLAVDSNPPIPFPEPSLADDSNSGYQDWYGPGTDTTEVDELDQERISHIVHFWNRSAWDETQSYLEAYLESLLEREQFPRARRVRHLIGISLSFKGLWTAAIPYFLSAMRTPVTDIFQLDDGDCAAAYWLGDIYALLNQRTEALLAYCIAERSSLFQSPANPGLAQCISAEQEAVRLGKSEAADIEAAWTQLVLPVVSADGLVRTQSILNPMVVTKTAAMALIQNEPRRARRIPYTTNHSAPFRLDPSRSRSSSFMVLDGMAMVGKYSRLGLVPKHFEPNTPWPMVYDPLFVMANVGRNRLLSYECDLVTVFNSNADAKIPRSSSLAKMDCFTANDLVWLIKTIRACLTMLEMQWSEVATVGGTRFVARYSFMQTKIATTYYFSIALYKHSLRPGYAAEICPDGISSARIIRSGWEHINGVHISEGKRIKKLIREYLDDAAKEQGGRLKRMGSSAVMQTDASAAGKGIRSKFPAALRSTK